VYVVEYSTSAPKRDAYASHIPAATAAPLPPELPPAERRSRACQSKVLDGCWYGLTTGPWTEWTFKDLQRHVSLSVRCGRHRGAYPMPNSSQFVFPMIVAPEANNWCTTVASKGDRKSGVHVYDRIIIARSSGASEPYLPRSMAEEHVVGIFLVHMLSLTATVMPFNGPSETGPASSSGTTCTSAFTLAFFCSTA
jgi:hypothetical protein